ncbi:MAG: hypothetical protein JW759_08220 [Candidatus Coatesbacteria bacterium]|nr:hypothetical protein [Candidatus Coatesbacteria bacterium]
MQIKGATRIHAEEFEKGANFVDLHLDFPVSFGEYAMGRTPFMAASMRVGLAEMQMHKMRVNYLNDVYAREKEIKDIFALYKKQKHDLFKKKALLFLDSRMPCDTQLDRNRALYFVIERAFFPFSDPRRNADAVELFTRELVELEQANKDSLSEFINEIVSSGFLRNVQTDCLEVYPRIIDMELMLRPALFLDFDKEYNRNLVAYRVSAHEFLDVKDLYKDIAEIISRAIVLVAGINNLKKRGSHNRFFSCKGAPRSMHKFADFSLGSKLNHIDDSWYTFEGSVMDNELRNPIAHYKAEYDEVTQEITYFPEMEGIKQEHSKSMYFLDFSRRILMAFRELHRLNHLTKCLFAYYYLRVCHEKGTPCDL